MDSFIEGQMNIFDYIPTQEQAKKMTKIEDVQQNIDKLLRVIDKAKEHQKNAQSTDEYRRYQQQITLCSMQIKQLREEIKRLEG